MSNIDKRALRVAAEKATKGQWAVEFDDEIYATDGVNHEQIAMVFSENEARDAAFIAAANPATVLALLDEMEAADNTVAQLNNEICNLLPGVQYMDPPDGGSVTPIEQVRRMVVDYREQMEAAEKRIAELEARTVTLPDEPFYPDGDIDCPLAVNLVDIKTACDEAGVLLVVRGGK